MAKEITPGLVQSLNTRVDLVVRATAFHDLNAYGQIMIGDKGFEFYNQRNVKDFIQIPWEEVELIIASIYFGGRYIPRLAIRTKKNGDFPFAIRQPRAFLRACRNHFPAEKIVRSLTFRQVLVRNAKWLAGKITKK